MACAASQACLERHDFQARTQPPHAAVRRRASCARISSMARPIVARVASQVAAHVRSPIASRLLSHCVVACQQARPRLGHRRRRPPRRRQLAVQQQAGPRFSGAAWREGEERRAAHERCAAAAAEMSARCGASAPPPFPPRPLLPACGHLPPRGPSRAGAARPLLRSGRRARRPRAPSRTGAARLLPRT